MRKSKFILILKILNRFNIWSLTLFFIFLLVPFKCYGRISIDINSPSITKIKIAVPDFKNYSKNNESPELAGELAGIIANDLDLSGYFLPMDKNSFLDEDGPEITADNIKFRNWSLINTELLIKGAYTCIGRSLEVSIRLYDPFTGKQEFGIRRLGKINEYRHLMHRIGNEIIKNYTGSSGIFLSRFLFVNDATGNKEIYVCDFDGHNIKKLTSDKSIALMPRWSPDGESFVYNSIKEGGWMLYLMGISSGKTKKISGRNGLNMGARWSKDGKSLDLTLSYDRENQDIYTIDLEGKIMERLTNHWGGDLSPTRSPDGSKIAFVSDRSVSPQIYIMDLEAGYEERISYEYKGVKFKEATSPVWSSLNRIAFSAVSEESNGKYDIYTINPDGTGLKQLTENNRNNEDPCWSPDGRFIVFSSDRSGGYHLYIMNGNGYNQRRITYFTGEEEAPHWSPY
jgi:TolB protein